MKIEIGLNKVIRALILSDFFLQSGWGLIGPIFAIFLTKQIQGGNLVSVGLIAATYWLTKSIVQPFIAYFFDLKKGERDDFKALIFGLYLANAIPLGYLLATEVWHIFFLEFIRGLAMACVIPAWSAIFTRHIDKGWEAFSWSIESTSIGLAFGFSAAFGGIIANFLGFKILFVLVTILGWLSATVLLKIKDQIFLRDHFQPTVPHSEKPF